MNLEETKKYKINETDDFCGNFYVPKSIELLQERKGNFKTDKGNRIDIYIKESCGNEPHINLRDHTGKICRIKLRANEYQRDAYEKKNGHTLSANEREAFNNYMRSIVPGTKNITQWERLCMDWNAVWTENNEGKSGGLVDISGEIPNYSTIKESKIDKKERKI